MFQNRGNEFLAVQTMVSLLLERQEPRRATARTFSTNADGLHRQRISWRPRRRDPCVLERAGARFRSNRSSRDRYQGSSDVRSASCDGMLGLKRVLVSDGEPAIFALVTAVQLARHEETDPHRWRAIENANKMVGCLFRTLRAKGLRLPIGHWIMGWMVRHSGWLLGRSPIKQDGLMPYQHLKGRACDHAEAVTFKKHDASPHKAELGSHRRTPSRQRGWEAHCPERDTLRA